MASETSDPLSPQREDIRRFVDQAQEILRREKLTQTDFEELEIAGEQIRSRARDGYNLLRPPPEITYGPPLEIHRAAGVTVAWELKITPRTPKAYGLMSFPDGRKVQIIRHCHRPLAAGDARLVYAFSVGSDLQQIQHSTLQLLVGAIERALPAGSIPSGT
jgi:hypothetical protein